MGITIARQHCTWVPVPMEKGDYSFFQAVPGYQIGFGILVSRHIVTRPCETIPPLSMLYMGILLLY